MKDKKDRSPEEIKKDLGRKYGKGKAQRHKEHNQDYTVEDLDALRYHVSEHSPSKVKEITEKQEKERTKNATNRTIRMGYAMHAGIGNKQSTLDQNEIQQERNKHAKELLEYKYTKLSSARSFDKASDPATKEKKYLKAKSKTYFSKEK